MNLQPQNPTDFYMKTIYYGQYIRNIVMPLERIKANTRTASGLKSRLINYHITVKIPLLENKYLPILWIILLIEL